MCIRDRGDGNQLTPQHNSVEDDQRTVGRGECDPYCSSKTGNHLPLQQNSKERNQLTEGSCEPGASNSPDGNWEPQGARPKCTQTQCPVSIDDQRSHNANLITVENLLPMSGEFDSKHASVISPRSWGKAEYQSVDNTFFHAMFERNFFLWAVLIWWCLLVRVVCLWLFLHCLFACACYMTEVLITSKSHWPSSPVFFQAWHCTVSSRICMLSDLLFLWAGRRIEKIKGTAKGEQSRRKSTQRQAEMVSLTRGQREAWWKTSIGIQSKHKWWEQTGC